ncbi:dihydrofolate reductase [Paenibacillus sp. MMO-177]|uniref:dihydrofolate reductase n=1 Tax=Paenibacillus sp. MMO-177 TaxID=3081289 RepID=UPI0030185C47
MLSIIVACDTNGAIGKGNALPWKLKNDMQHFVEKTTGNTVIMGRRTYESIGFPLPNRKNIILTRGISISMTKHIESCWSFNDLVRLYAESEEEVFVIGGQQIYEQFLPFAKRVYMTHVITYIKGADAWFPLDSMGKEWKCTKTERHEMDADNEFTHYIMEFERNVD